MKKLLNGRYGFDQLSHFIMSIALILALISLIFDLKLIYFIALLLLIYVTYRALSKKIYSRRQENMKFLAKSYPYQLKALKYLERQQDKKTHKYFKCPNCKQTLRVPKGHGLITVTCPKCHHQFDKKS